MDLSRACFVATDGSDTTGDGSMARPFRTLAQAAAGMTAGDTCYVRGGHYAEPLVLDGCVGTPGNPVTFAAYPDERVVLDGTVAVTSRWERYKGSIYKTRLAQDVWQLFLDGEILTTARFPDAGWSDGSIWDLRTSCRHLAPGSRFGLMVDERPPDGDGSPGEERDDEGTQVWAARVADGVNTISLAESGIDFTGAVAVLHIGSWLSWAQTVQHHEPGSDRFTYSTDFAKSGGMAHSAKAFAGNESFFTRKNLDGGQGYYFLEGLQCLDQPGEWYYTPTDRMLYLHAPDGKNPTGRDIRGKVRSYNVVGADCSHVVLKGLNFFGTTFQFRNSSHVRVEDCRFDYPGYNKLVLGDYRRPETGGFFVDGRTRKREGGTRMSRSHHCVVENCIFRRMDGPALELQGENHRVANDLFFEIDYTCLGDGGEGSINMGGSTAAIFRRNTIHTTGNSEGIRVGREGVVELNHVYNMGLIQHDGSQINLGVSAQEGSIVRRNWSHDSYKAAVRFDSAGMGDAASVRYGRDGTMAHNVSWNCGPMKVKGDAHTVVGNTGFSGIGDRGVTLSVLDSPKMGGINKATTSRNNLGVLSGHFRHVRPLPGQASGNRHVADAAHVSQLLRDPLNLDFRPRARSPLIDAGEVVPGVTGEYVGDAPDIGAYESGAREYWIPGYRSAAASTPVPPDGTQSAEADVDLMWLQGYMSDSHEVYFGRDRAAVEEAGKRSPKFKGNQEFNVYDPGELEVGATYFWRIDTVRHGTVETGRVWSFSVGAK